MVRLALVSDVHGNLPALEAVLADARGQGAEQIVALGDLGNYGPFSNECFALAWEGRWPVIRGNGEYYLTDFGTPRGDPSWVRPGPVTTLAAWFHAHTDPRWREWVGAWPDQLCLRIGDTPPLRVVHGSPRSAYEGMHSWQTDEQMRERLADPAEATIVFGHTHEPHERRLDRWQLVNPGSVGNPLDGDQRARYALFDGDADGWRPTFRRVAYDVQATIDEYRRQGVLEAVGAMALMVVRELETARAHLGPYIRWRRAEHPDEPSTLELGAEFDEAARRAYAGSHEYQAPPR